MKPLYLRTYGKAKRKLSAWLSPDDRKQAFNSSTDGDVSVFEPEKPKNGGRKARVASRKRACPLPRKKAVSSLTNESSNEENILPPQQSKSVRVKKTTASSSGAIRSAKRKAMVLLIETSSDEENMPLSPQPHPPQQSKRTRKSRVVSVPEVPRQRQDDQQVSVTSDCEGVSRSTATFENTSQIKRNPHAHPSSVSRFVTRRRRTVAAKPRVPRATFILNSSDDFAPGAFDCSNVRKPRRRRIPASFFVSSAENSINAANFATNPFREISLNESTDQSLRPYTRKPIFCSTPSAGPLIKRPQVKPLSMDDPSSNSASISLSCIGVVNTFHEDLSSPPPCSPPPIKLNSDESQSSGIEKEPQIADHEEPPVDLFTQPMRSSSREAAKCHSEDTKSKIVVELPSSKPLSTEDSESSSHFVSAAGGLEWLIEALKGKCLTEFCTVQLQRLNYVTMTQPYSQTTFSSCLENPSSVLSGEKDKHSVSVDSVPTVDLSECSEYVVTGTDSQSTNNALAEDYEKAASPHMNSSVEFIMDTQVPAKIPVQTLLSEEEAVAGKITSLIKDCTVVLHRAPLSQVAVHELKCDDKSASKDVQKSEQDHQENLRCTREITDTTVESVGQSINYSTTFETEALTSMLKEECLTNSSIVRVKKLTMSQLKEKLKLKDKGVESCTDSSSDGKTNHLCLSDTNDPSEDISSNKVGMKRGSTSSEDKEKAALRNVSHSRSKTSLAPREKKRRSTSANRPGTNRKACVSGLSISRWKSRDATSTHTFRSRAVHTDSNKSVDCSITELISTQRKQPQELLSAMTFSTPLKASQLSLSSLLLDLTPNTHTWSRLKAALSVHRKGMVLHTPGNSHQTPGRTRLVDLSQDLFATPFRTPLSKRFQSQLMSHDSSVVFEEADLSDAEKVYAECGQQCPLPWDQCILPERMKRCQKIGEGTFGEVFSTTNASGDTVALKIIPVEGSEKVNGEDQKTLGEILHEIIISKELSSLKDNQQNQTHGFIGLNDLHCVQGCYPPDFLNAWDTFDKKKTSENDRPDFFGKDQVFIILEFEFGGVDLENSSGTLASLGVAKSILHQVTAALAVAEQELHFEHRDLHWGNVLVKTTKQKKSSFLLNGSAHSVEIKGVLVRIIDYSLSRLEIDDLTVSCDISLDEELFMGQGDYQFDIYRLMRQENGNNWANYHPHTNVLWLHYLCSKLLSMKYRGSGGRGAKDMREELTRFHDNVLQYSSATETLQNCPMFQ